MEKPRSVCPEAGRNHPCFSEEALPAFDGVHLPVAPSCNIQCGYCEKKIDGNGETARTILTPEAALSSTRAMIEKNPRLKVVGLAGPGEPLANAATYTVLRRLNREFPHLTLCVSTNGLLLPDRLEQLIAADVRSISLTVNAVAPETAARVYSSILYRGRRYSGLEAARFLLANQWRGLELAVAAGLSTAVNAVLIPGINAGEIPLVAERAAELGADAMNLLPLASRAEFGALAGPLHDGIAKMRKECLQSIQHMTCCTPCWAGVCGVRGVITDADRTVLSS